MFYLLHSYITFTFQKLVIFIFIYSNCLSYLISAIMSSNYPIIALLTNEKLSGDNFVKRKSNINIVLICENQKFFSLRNVLQSPLLMLLVLYEKDMIVGFIPITKPVVTCLLA